MSATNTRHIEENISIRYAQITMNIHELTGNIEACVILTFSRSSGPGGQNVNKRSTQVHARIPVGELVFLSDNEKQVIRKSLASRINKEDELVVHVQDSRSQWANRQRAIHKLGSLILTALSVSKQKPRMKTKPSKTVRESRLQTKHRHSMLKKLRNKISPDE